MRERRNLITKEKKKKKWILWITISLLVLLLIGGAVLYFMLDRYSYKEMNLTDEELGIEQPAQPKPVVEEEKEEVAEVNEYEGQIINIALFGLDRRDTDSKNTRSDSMMVATVDFQHNKLKLTSLMRDMYVEIEGKNDNKLNAAYAFGGAELAVKTINQNFGLDVRDYVTVDFFMLRDIINAIGGVEIEVSEEELPLLNEHMQEIASKEGKTAAPLKASGLQLLTGEQAVAYSRIRYVGNGDFERTERQQKVLQAMLNRINVASKVELTKLFLQISPYIETSLAKDEIISLAWNYLSEENMELEKMRYPLDGEWSADYTSGGAWIMNVDAIEQKKSIQDWIYNDINPLGEDETEDTVDEKEADSNSNSATVKHTVSPNLVQ